MLEKCFLNNNTSTKLRNPCRTSIRFWWWRLLDCLHSQPPFMPSQLQNIFWVQRVVLSPGIVFSWWLQSFCLLIPREQKPCCAPIDSFHLPTNFVEWGTALLIKKKNKRWNNHTCYFFWKGNSRLQLLLNSRFVMMCKFHKLLGGAIKKT